jgi:hypothetical protein
VAFQRAFGNAATGATLQRRIVWKPESSQQYARGAAQLLDQLAVEFPHVEKEELQRRLGEVEGARVEWTPSQARRGIADHLRATFGLPLKSIQMHATSITMEDAETCFLKGFKTFVEVVVDGRYAAKFTNTTGEHAERNATAWLDDLIRREGWDTNFAGAHTLEMRISNSPCESCAAWLYEWGKRDIFVEFTISFANMYDMEGGFTTATTKLRSGGVLMRPMSVTGDLLPLIDKEYELKAQHETRRKKDYKTAVGWTNWKAQNEPESRPTEMDTSL